VIFIFVYVLVVICKARGILAGTAGFRTFQVQRYNFFLSFASFLAENFAKIAKKVTL
jgi:hypothetical protein